MPYRTSLQQLDAFPELCRLILQINRRSHALGSFHFARHIHHIMNPMPERIFSVKSDADHRITRTPRQKRKARLKFVQITILSALSFGENHHGATFLQFFFGKQSPFRIQIEAVTGNAVRRSENPVDARLFKPVLRNHNRSFSAQNRKNTRRVNNRCMICNHNARLFQFVRLHRLIHKMRLGSVDDIHIEAHQHDGELSECDQKIIDCFLYQFHSVNILHSAYATYSHKTSDIPR